MEPHTISKLICCIDLCEELEHLLQRDLEEISHSMTGEVCKVYQESVLDTMERVQKLKHQIVLLHSQQAALL